MTITRVGSKTYEIKSKLIRSDEEAVFEKKLNEFLIELHSDELIDIKYNSTPLAVATHTEYGVYPNIDYSALVIYKIQK
jgi:hypothetical protein